ncbi:MAG TPA: uracil-DNA glycosylase [Rhodocyclaceae bacterium]|nr:uracil-DNA glycosylase [Burkholderiales bacterium]HNB78541.1 uracil-DNA glycosylase [Rhodocyclaceae bacterium]HNC61166.1 uracil-DNA glycosylase [Rhodocyclaceae bacterium]
MSARRNEILREIGLGPLWRLREAPPFGAGEPAAEAPDDSPPATPATPSPAGAPGAVARADAISGMDWPQLAEATAACRACRLCERRKQAVLGVGDLQPQVLFVGEGPGADEDERGEPFVGQAGKLLDAMLGSIGLARGRGVYIANTVKCRPPENRTPQAEEMTACFPYLKRQIALLQPRLIVALGRPAAQVLLDAEVKIGAARGRVFDHDGIPLVVTYHPAYLLRNLPDKARAWEDLCLIRRLASQPAA